MHLLVLVFFNAPQGGLHENVRATAQFMLSRQHNVTVVCRPGPFSEQMREEGVGVIETDYEPGSFSRIVEKIKALHALLPIDVVHSHPFASRELGMIVSQILGLPFVVTMHGKYLDNLPTTIDEIDAVFTVSEGIRQHLLVDGAVKFPEKFAVVPNTPDTQLFRPMEVAPLEEAKGRKVISLVTRLDQDKAFILDIFYQVVAYAAERYSGAIHWQVVGQGTLQSAFVERVETLRGLNSVSYTGWLQGESLRDAYCQSDAVIAPGRCALEAMSCGVPAIALGSKGYIGLVDSKRWQEAIYCNFGGVGNKHDNYEQGTVERDLDILLASEEVRSDLGALCADIVRRFFCPLSSNLALLSLYETVIQARHLNPRRPVAENTFLQMLILGVVANRLEPDLLSIEVKCREIKKLKFAWYLIESGNVIDKSPYQVDPVTNIRLPGNGKYQVRCFVKDDSGNKISFITASVTLDDGARLKHALHPGATIPSLSGNTGLGTLLKLHQSLRETRPNVVVGMGCDTEALVVADALRQNGIGKFVYFRGSSIEAYKLQEVHDEVALNPWIDLRDSRSYEAVTSMPTTTGIEGIDFVWIGIGFDTVKNSYGLDLLSTVLSRTVPNAELWMREEIIEEVEDLFSGWVKEWKADESFECPPNDLKILRLERASNMSGESVEDLKARCQALVEQCVRERAELAEQVSRLQEENAGLRQETQALEHPLRTMSVIDPHSMEDAAHPERALGLDFSLPENRR